jgi:hypothetical protein
MFTALYVDIRRQTVLVSGMGFFLNFYDIYSMRVVRYSMNPNDRLHKKNLQALFFCKRKVKTLVACRRARIWDGWKLQMSARPVGRFIVTVTTYFPLNSAAPPQMLRDRAL